MAGVTAEAPRKAPEKRGYRKLREVRIERGDGGVMVHHHHTQNSGEYKEPGPPKVISSHKEFMEHMSGVSKKMGLASGSEPELQDEE